MTLFERMSNINKVLKHRQKNIFMPQTISYCSIKKLSIGRQNIKENKFQNNQTMITQYHFNFSLMHAESYEMFISYFQGEF